MLDTVLGLPIHPLVVHATVVTVPVAVLLVLVCVFWPRTRTKLAWPTVALSVLATVFTAAAALSGGPLARRLPPSDAIAQHAAYAKLLAVTVVAMTGAVFLLAYTHWYRSGAPVASWLRMPEGLRRLATPTWLRPVAVARWVLPVVATLSLLTAAGTGTAVVLVGHSGASAAWSGVANLPPRSDARHH